MIGTIHAPEEDPFNSFHLITVSFFTNIGISIPTNNIFIRQQFFILISGIFFMSTQITTFKLIGPGAKQRVTTSIL